MTEMDTKFPKNLPKKMICYRCQTTFYCRFDCEEKTEEHSEFLRTFCMCPICYMKLYKKYELAVKRVMKTCWDIKCGSQLWKLLEFAARMERDE